MSSRVNRVIVIIGGRGTGKTTFTKKLFPIYKNANKKVLIVDTFEHPSYLEVPRIEPEAIPRWKKGIYKAFDKKPQIIIDQLHTVYNALIVFEDCRKYVKNTVQDEIRELIIDSKQKNVDLLFIYHSWGMVPPELFRMADFIQVFKTADSPEVRKSLMAGVFVEAMQVYQEVEKSKNKYETITLDISN